MSSEMALEACRELSAICPLPGFLESHIITLSVSTCRSPQVPNEEGTSDVKPCTQEQDYEDVPQIDADAGGSQGVAGLDQFLLAAIGYAASIIILRHRGRLFRISGFPRLSAAAET
jgi:hypothetical protein